MNNRYEHEDASGECQVTGLLLVEKFTAPKLSLTSDSTWPRDAVSSPPHANRPIALATPLWLKVP